MQGKNALLSRKEVSKILNVSIRTVDRYVKSGKLETQEIDGRIWINKVDKNSFKKNKNNPKKIVTSQTAVLLYDKSKNRVNNYTKPVDKPVDKTIDKPLKKIVDKTVDKIVDKPVDKPVDKFVNENKNRDIINNQLTNQINFILKSTIKEMKNAQYGELEILKESLSETNKNLKYQKALKYIYLSLIFTLVGIIILYMAIRIFL